MTSWDIDPAGIEEVLKRVSAAAKPLDAAFKTFTSGIQSGISATGVAPCTVANPQGQTGSDIVEAALATWAASASKQGEAIVGRFESAGYGCVEAAKQYLKGDEAMARHAQQQAAAGTFKPVFTRTKN
jgi:hypothetical protein